MLKQKEIDLMMKMELLVGGFQDTIFGKEHDKELICNGATKIKYKDFENYIKLIDKLMKEV